jgi:B12-binding domain/radical SAM domain protein
MSTIDLTFLHAPSVYDFRRESILYGPVSDMVPSTPVFEMYPIGFTTMAEYLERNGYQCRIVNLAVRMLEDVLYDVEETIRKMDSAIFGIDLHWLPHAHGSIEVAKIVKRLHPDRPVLFGGLSATYFHEELIQYPAVDFILRGDSTEYPLLEFVRYIHSGGATRPAPNSIQARELEKIPNLVWKDNEGHAHVNPLTYSPDSLDGILLDYSRVVKSVVRDRDLASYIPFRAWMRYPITAALTVRGCSYNCTTCGGGCAMFRKYHNRQKPAFRNPVDLANDIRRIGAFSKGPVMVLGDIRQAGSEYADKFLESISGYRKPLYFELFDAWPRDFTRRLSQAIPNYVIEISMESHDEHVRRAFGRPYSNQSIEHTIEDALEFGCQRLDLFFMIGIKEQTYQSVMDTVEYSRNQLQKYSRNGIHHVVPFISPMAPFLDPGSRAFEEPEKHGYRLFARTLEEHRRKLLEPSWKYVLNYETIWMNRDQIAAATYEAGRRMNEIKAEFGVISAEKAAATETRINLAVQLMAEIDELMKIEDIDTRKSRILELKYRVLNSNESTICDKRELETPMKGLKINVLGAARMVMGGWWNDAIRAISGRSPELKPSEAEETINR